MKPILQSESSECALASLAMVASKHGLNISLPELRQRFPLSLKGAKLGQLIHIAQALGLQTRALRLELEDLGKLALPCILHWDLNHFVVLQKISGRRAVILDPAIGERRLSLAEVSAHFTGVALELTPGATFTPRKAQPAISIRQLTGRLSGLWRALAQSLSILLGCGVRIKAFLFAAMVFSSDVFAEDCVALSNREFLSGNYYNSYLALERNHSLLQDNFSRQLKCQAGTFVGKEDGSCMEDAGELNPSEFSYVDAVVEISRLAREKRVVILNESHHHPLHRAFAYSLAMALRREGYGYMAIEALANDGQVIESDVGFGKDGYYIKEPAFFGLLRGVLRAGYKVFPYEQTRAQELTGTIEEREEAQAENLSRIINSLPSDAKIFVYVGYSHAAKYPIIGSSGKERQWMATRLWQKTGIEPLTIDQTGFADAPWPDGHDASGSFLVQREGKNVVYGMYSSVMDVQVAHFYQGRQQWMQQLMGRVAFQVPASLLPQHGSWNVQAFLDREGVSSVPVEQVVVDSSGGVMMLDGEEKYVFRIEQGRSRIGHCEPKKYDFN